MLILEATRLKTGLEDMRLYFNPTWRYFLRLQSSGREGLQTDTRGGTTCWWQPGTAFKKRVHPGVVTKQGRGWRQTDTEVSISKMIQTSSDISKCYPCSALVGFQTRNFQQQHHVVKILSCADSNRHSSKCCLQFWNCLHNRRRFSWFFLRLEIFAWQSQGPFPWQHIDALWARLSIFQHNWTVCGWLSEDAAEQKLEQEKRFRGKRGEGVQNSCQFQTFCFVKATFSWRLQAQPQQLINGLASDWTFVHSLERALTGGGQFPVRTRKRGGGEEEEEEKMEKWRKRKKTNWKNISESEILY